MRGRPARPRIARFPDRIIFRKYLESRARREGGEVEPISEIGPVDSAPLSPPDVDLEPIAEPRESSRRGRESHEQEGRQREGGGREGGGREGGRRRRGRGRGKPADEATVSTSDVAPAPIKELPPPHAKPDRERGESRGGQREETVQREEQDEPAGEGGRRRRRGRRGGRGRAKGGNERGGNERGAHERGGSERGGSERGGNERAAHERGGNERGGAERGGRERGGRERGGRRGGGRRDYNTGRSASRALRILVTAGPTREYVDPVRFLSNDSSGRMGFALAEEAAARGHTVTLVHGPVALEVPEDVDAVPVVSAADMLAACQRAWQVCDVLLMTAAVADYTPKEVVDTKIKKMARAKTLSLQPTVDILATLASSRRENQRIIGFALEDTDGRKHAEAKLRKKNLDAVVLNGPETIGAEETAAELLVAGGQWQTLPRAAKLEIAERLIDLAEELVPAPTPRMPQPMSGR